MGYNYEAALFLSPTVPFNLLYEIGLSPSRDQPDFLVAFR